MPVMRTSVINAHSQLGQERQRRMAREINLQRRHRNEAFADGIEVGAGPASCSRPAGPTSTPADPGDPAPATWARSGGEIPDAWCENP